MDRELGEGRSDALLVRVDHVTGAESLVEYEVRLRGARALGRRVRCPLRKQRSK